MDTQKLITAYESGFAVGWNAANVANPYGVFDVKRRKAWQAGWRDGNKKRKAIKALQDLQAEPEPVKDIPMNERQKVFEW